MTGLVLEGGAMRGLFTAGVLDVFMENGIKFDNVIGVSAGACFGCNYVSGQIGRAIRYNMKYAKDKTTGKYRLVGLGESSKPNVSGLKLTYTAKTGVFKGTFKLYTTTGGDKPKLKKFTVNVIGFVVDGVGYGTATLKKPAGGPWTVTVE